MQTQYSYNPPSGSGMPDWLQRIRPLFQEPLCYATAGGLFILALYLSINGSEYGPRLLILLFAFPVHELAHAIVADRLGDWTPRQHGRITLNPFAQLDIIGSMLILAIGLGWAYVPINPYNLRPNPRLGHLLVAVAGPISNLIMAVLAAIIWYIISPALGTMGEGGWVDGLAFTFLFFTFINVALFFFNLIPLAPLDGFYVLRGFLPDELAYQLDRLQQYSMIIFLVVFLILPLAGFDIILGPLIFTPSSLITAFLYSF